MNRQLLAAAICLSLAASALAYAEKEEPQAQDIPPTHVQQLQETQSSMTRTEDLKPAAAEENQEVKLQEAKAPENRQPMSNQEKSMSQTQSAVARYDIVDTATKAGDFKTFEKAVQAAGLTSTLKGNSKFTVFAPTDEAFAKLPAGTVDRWMKPENKAELRKIMKFHVVSGEVPAEKVAKAENVRSLEGESLHLTNEGGVKVNSSANVVKSDLYAKNGVIHGIDKVLMPK